MSDLSVQSWLEKAVTARGGVESAIVLVNSRGLGPEPAHWPAEAPRDEALLAIAQAACDAGPDVHAAKVDDPRIIMSPVRIAGKVAGAVVMRLAPTATMRSSDRVEMPKGREPAPAQQAQPAQGPLAHALTPETAVNLHAIRVVLAEPDFERAAMALATELAAKFSCERVFVGMSAGGFVHVKGLSHGARLGPAQGLARVVGAAMDEAVDQGAAILYPQHPDDLPRITLSHSALSHFVAGNFIWLTVPMYVDGEAVGALSFERRNSVAFGADEQRAIAGLAQTMAPLLQLKYRATGPRWQLWLRPFNPRQAGSSRLQGVALSGAVLLGLAVLAWALLTPRAFEVSATTRIEGQMQRSVVASQDGFLKTALARAGDRVTAGQLMAEFNDEDLQLERRRLETELARHENSFAQAQAKADRTELVIAEARAAESRAQLAQIDQQLARTRLLAPFDALVIKGDLAQQLGSPFKRGDLMLTLTPSSDFRVMLEIDERDVGLVKAGARGALTLSALPESSFPLVVERILPVAKVDAGRNLFEAEARMGPLSDAQALRPGMQGVARLQAGERPLYWMLSHRVVDWLRLQKWLWLG